MQPQMMVKPIVNYIQTPVFIPQNQQLAPLYPQNQQAGYI
jgi:hypothetical protein